MTAPINSGNDPMRHVQDLQFRMNGASGTIQGGGQAITQAQQLAPGQSVTSPDELSKVYGRDQLRLSEEAMEMRAGGPGKDQGLYSPPVLALMENMKHEVSTGKDNPHKDRSFDFFSILKGSREEKPDKTAENIGSPRENEGQEKTEGSSFKDLVMGMLSQAMSSSGSDEPEQDGQDEGQAPGASKAQPLPEFSLPEFLSAARQEVNINPELPKHSGDSPFNADWARNRILSLTRD